MLWVVELATRATPEQFFNRQPRVHGIEEPVTVAQAPMPIFIPYQQPSGDNIKLIVVGGIIILGVVGIVAIVALATSGKK